MEMEMSKLGEAQSPAHVASSRQDSKRKLLEEYHDRPTRRGQRLCLFATVVAMLCGGVGALVWAGKTSSSANTAPEESLADDASRAVDGVVGDASDDLVSVLDVVDLSEEDLTLLLGFLSSMQASLTCTDINYALCDISTCSVANNSASSNVAQCGCISKRASAGDSATLALGWASGLMAHSTTYLKWLIDINETYADQAQGAAKFAAIEAYACDTLRSNDASDSIWASIGASRVSMYGSNSPEIDDASLTTLVCPDTLGANCQGAPCFAQDYGASDSIFNLTCLCQVTPVASQYISSAADDDATTCDSIAAGPCAVVSASEMITNMTELDRQIVRIKRESAKLVATADASECPEYA